MRTITRAAPRGAHPRPTLAPEGWSLALHPNGGLLTRTDDDIDLRAGDGVVFDLRLSSGVSMQFSAQVRWVRERGSASGEQPGAWIDFIDLSTPERREFQRWLRSFRLSRGSAPVEVSLARKYRVRREGPKLSVWIRGRLELSESKAIAAQVEEALASTRGATLALMIDATEFRPSPEDSLRAIRGWLDEIAGRYTVLGLLLGTRSVGNMQFARLVREAGLGDSLVNFASFEAGQDTWAMIVSEVGALDSAAHSGTFERRPEPRG